MEKITIDGADTHLGRLSSFAAKKALEGNEIIIVNSDKVVITGNRKDILDKYSKLRKLGGTSHKGPIYKRPSYMMLKRSIRGMLPDYRKGIGKQAFSRIKCYEGFPSEFEKNKLFKLKTIKNDKQIELKEVSKSL